MLTKLKTGIRTSTKNLMLQQTTISLLFYVPYNIPVLASDNIKNLNRKRARIMNYYGFLKVRGLLLNQLSKIKWNLERGTAGTGPLVTRRLILIIKTTRLEPQMKRIVIILKTCRARCYE
uniref:Uncharacterized protein n=1 Tax=Ciona intestinalis TaxID=7719 RepID=H2Y0Y6_CIOIN